MHRGSRRQRVGAWFVGARGSVATTARVGAAAVGAGLAPPQGLVTALPPFSRPGLSGLLPELDDLVFGGHDLATTPLGKRAEELAAAGVLPAAVLPAVADTLEGTDREIRPGIDPTGPPRVAVESAAADIAAFRARHGLDTVVVVCLSSTEAVPGDWPADLSASGLARRLDGGSAAADGSGAAGVPVGVLAACAAVEAGCPFVDFTPSVATQMPALAELAADRGVPYAGRDGKTGETLLKTALAPLFAYRNLRVRSWAGTNLLGGSDGAALADPARAASKLASKQRGLAAILGAEPAGPLHIDYVPDLGEWKTAWDHVAFEGFLGTRMSLQFTWQGCDSALAAPLVLDLVRLVAAAHRAGRVGPLGDLAFFFKDPVGASEHALERQYHQLCTWAASLPAPEAPQ